MGLSFDTSPLRRMLIGIGGIRACARRATGARLLWGVASGADIIASRLRQETRIVMDEWPFKRLSEKSSWPLQGLVLSLAAPLRMTKGAPAEAIQQAAWKGAERLFRAGARFSYEFGLEPVKLLAVARKQIEREVPGAKAKLKAADAEAFEAKALAAEALTAQMKSFGSGDPGASN